MELDPNDIILSLSDGLNQIQALVVAYAFSVVGAILLLIAGYVIAGSLERWSYRGLSRIRGFDETLRRFLSKLLRYALLILVGVTVLSQFGVQTASLIAALGAAGLAIGLALQGTLQNIAAGIMLLVLKPFKVGEYVVAGNVSGIVVEIGLFATELRGLDGVYMLAPNSVLWNTPVTNFSRNGNRRNDLVMRISYADDIGLARDTLAGIALRDRRVLPDPAPTTYVSELADNALMITLRYWTATNDWWETRLAFTEAAKLAFDERGITIPLPQRDVHLHAVPEKADAALA